MAHLWIGQEFHPEEIQVLIRHRCSDARSEGNLEELVFNALRFEYGARGIIVEAEDSISAGAVIDGHTMPEIKRRLHAQKDRYIDEHEGRITVEHKIPRPSDRILLSMTVQIEGHAHIKKPDEDKLVYLEDEIQLDDQHTVANCGMSKAKEVWKAVLDLIDQKKPQMEFYDDDKQEHVKMRITKDNIGVLLKHAYGFEDNPEDFVPSVDLLKSPLDSRNYLRRGDRGLSNDHELRRIPVHANAAIHDFRTGRVYRIDENGHIHTIRDDQQTLVALALENLSDKNPEKQARNTKQEPTLGLIASSTVSNPKRILLEQINGGLNVVSVGKVFGTQGLNVTNPFSKFARHKLLGIIYSIMSLNIKEYYVMGSHNGETQAIEDKIKNDPILKFIIDEFRVKITRTVAGSSDIMTPQNSPELLNAMRTAIDQFKPLRTSSLHRDIKHPAFISMRKALLGH